MSLRDETPALYLSIPHQCSYLSERTATTLLIDPNFEVREPLGSLLIDQGFRRSGSLFYRPHCETCKSCVSVRIPVDAFRPNRAQKRAIKRNEDLSARILPAAYRQDHFQLYCKYQSSRHPGSSMDDDNPEKYVEFLTRSPINTHMLEFSLDKRPVGISTIDFTSDGISAIYTFFDPDLSARSIGTYAILYLTNYAKSLNFKWLFLGYWIAESSKMDYKYNFRPLEGFVNGRWQPLRD